MAKYTMEQIDYLREKATISYEEAVEVLEKNDGDLAHCMVELERRGRLKPQAKRGGRANYNPFAGMEGTAEQVYQKYQQQRKQQYQQGQDEDYQNRPKAFVLDPAWLKSIFFSRIVISKDGRVVVNLTVLLILIGACLAPWLALILLAGVFLTGCTIKWNRGEDARRQEADMYTFVDKTAENIRKTTDSFVETFKNEIRPQDVRPEDQAEYGSTEAPKKAKPGKPGDIAAAADAAEGESTEGEYTVE